MVLTPDSLVPSRQHSARSSPSPSLFVTYHISPPPKAPSFHTPTNTNTSPLFRTVVKSKPEASHTHTHPPRYCRAKNRLRRGCVGAARYVRRRRAEGGDLVGGEVVRRCVLQCVMWCRPLQTTAEGWMGVSDGADMLCFVVVVGVGMLR